MMSMKLDTAALERLMDSDNGQDIKLELQQAVIEEFGRRHIKAFANDGEFKKHINIAKTEAIKDIESMFGEWKGSYSNKKFELNTQIKDMVKLQAKTAVTYELDNVEEYVEETYKDTNRRLKEYFDNQMVKIDKQLQRYSDDIIAKVDETRERLLTEEMDFIIKSRVKEILAESFSVKA